MADGDIVIRRYNKEFVFPPGTSQDAIESYLSRNKPAAVPVSPPPRIPAQGTTGDFARAVGRGASFNFLDELSSAGKASIPGENDWSSRYTANLGEQRARDRQYDADNPVASTTGQVLGGLGTAAALYAATRGRRGSPVGTMASTGRQALGRSMAPAVAPAAAPGMLRRGAGLAGAGMGYGAASGALSGFGAGEDDLENRLGSALEGAGYGAATGAVIPPAVAMISSAARKAGRALIVPVAQRTAERAGRDIGTAAIEDKVTPGMAAVNVGPNAKKTFNPAEPTPRLADVSPELGGLMENATWALGRPSGPGNNERLARAVVGFAFNPDLYNVARMGTATPMWRSLWGRVSGMDPAKARKLVGDLATEDPAMARKLVEDAFQIMQGDAARRATTDAVGGILTVPMAERGTPEESRADGGYVDEIGSLARSLARR